MPEAPFIVGFEEWIGLPGIGLPALKAKFDTGAKTSALHATSLEPYREQGADHIRFKVQPVPRRPAIVVPCTAPLVGRRAVTSSNGEKESRYVIATTLAIGARQWTIELTLTDRSSMRYRMLIGRQAMQSGLLIDPSSSFRQPRLSHAVYRAKLKRGPSVP